MAKLLTAVLGLLLGIAALYFWPRFFAGQAQQMHRGVVETMQDAADRSELRARRRTARAAEARRLKEGERCLSGKYLRAIPGGYEDDPAQDWKCKSGR